MGFLGKNKNLVKKIKKNWGKTASHYSIQLYLLGEGNILSVGWQAHRLEQKKTPKPPHQKYQKNSKKNFQKNLKIDFS